MNGTADSITGQVAAVAETAQARTVGCSPCAVWLGCCDFWVLSPLPGPGNYPAPLYLVVRSVRLSERLLSLVPWPPRLPGLSAFVSPILGGLLGSPRQAA